MSVLIYTENWDGKFKKLTYELVSYGKTLADKLNVKLICATFGKVENDELKTLGKFGANKSIKIQSDEIGFLDNKSLTKALVEIAKKENSKVVLFSHNNTGKAIAPRLAVRLQSGLVSAISGLPSSYEPFELNSKVFNGNAMAKVAVKTENFVLTLLPNSCQIIENETACNIETIAFETKLADLSTKLLDTKKLSGQVLLADAEIVVSGGRGMRSGDNWQPLIELANGLGAALACSRPVADEGWRPHTEHVGQTGKVIAPNLYIAVGISGAIQHIAGVSSSKIIVAINKDPEAPVFETADYGIVGDAFKILPVLVEKIKEHKG